MSSNRLLRLTLCCLLVLAAGAVVTPAAAAPPPRPLCDACGGSFAETADGHGLALTVERSEATVSVHENGSATWVVRNRLGDSPDADRLRANATLRAAVADRAMWDAELLGANVSADGVVTLRYRESGFAERSVGGTYRSGAFTEAFGYRNLDGLGADRLVVVAPPETTVGWSVPGASVDDDGRRMVLTELDEGAVVTFVPDGALVGPLLSLLAVGSLVGPLLAIRAVAFGTLPVAVFSLFVGAAAGGVARLDRGFERLRDAPDVALAGVGVLAACCSLLDVAGLSLVGGLAAPVFGGGVTLVLGGAALSRTAVRGRLTYRTLLAATVAGTVVAAGLAVAAALAFDQSGSGQPLASPIAVLGPVFSLLPAGYAIGRENRRLAVLTAGGGFVLTTVTLLPVLPSPFGLGLLAVLVATAYAALAPVVGSPLLLIGVALGTARPLDE